MIENSIIEIYRRTDNSKLQTERIKKKEKTVSVKCIGKL